MSAFRKSGSFVAFTFQADKRENTDPTMESRFQLFLETHRFRTIDRAASEEVSAGWVTPEDPSGDSFELADMDAGPATWLRVRVDVKKLPKAQLQMHLAAATRAKGRQLSARERRELKDDLIEKLLPRVIPSTTNLDALLYHEKRLVLLFAAGKSARETFGKLFFESFGLPLELLGPRGLALHCGFACMPADIDKLEPTRWPVARRTA